MEKSKKTNIMVGGQALIEGIMMRGPNKMAAVARKQDGELAVKEEDCPQLKEKYPVLGWVIIRGVVNLITSLKIGLGALTWSAEFYPEEEVEKPSRFDLWLEKNFKSVEKAVTGVAMVLAFVIAIGLFTVLPTLIGGWLGLADSDWRNAVETGIRLVIMVCYMVLVSRMKDIQRTFAYHGAEHKAIACHEAEAELTVENVKKYSRFHPRCGTSFLLMVVLISMAAFLMASTIFPFLPWDHAFLRVVFRLSLLPFVVAVSYEVNRLVGKHDNRLTRILRAPGLAMQKLTTREPDDGMIEVAIEALRRVIPAEEGAVESKDDAQG